MIKYWVVGTSTKKYIKNYIELIKKIDISQLVKINSTDKKKVLLVNENNDKLIFFTSMATFNQCLCAWEALGLIKKNQTGFSPLIYVDGLEDAYNLTKYHLFQNCGDSQVLKYKISKIINVLFHASWITMSDINRINLKQTRGKLNKNKIESEIGEFERYLAKDKYYLEKAMEVFNDSEF